MLSEVFHIAFASSMSCSLWFSCEYWVYVSWLMLDAWCFSLFCLSFLSYLLHLLQKICEAFLLWICQNEMGRQTLLSTWTYEWYINQHNYFRVLYLQSYTAPYIVTSFSKRTRLKKEKSKQLYHILVSMLLISGQLVRLCGVFLNDDYYLFKTKSYTYLLW